MPCPECTVLDVDGVCPHQLKQWIREKKEEDAMKKVQKKQHLKPISKVTPWLKGWNKVTVPRSELIEFLNEKITKNGISPVAVHIVPSFPSTEGDVVDVVFFVMKGS